MDRLYSHAYPIKVDIMSIDGYYLDITPIQVKQSEDIVRNLVDNFETAIQKMQKKWNHSSSIQFL